MRDSEVSRELGETEGDEDFVAGLCLGDAIRFFLDAKRAGGRSERTLSEYRKKLDLSQRWAAGRAVRENDAVDAPVAWVGPDEVEAYVVHLRERVLSDTSRNNHLSIIRSFFDTLNRRLDPTGPARKLDEVRFHQKASKRSFLTRRKADMLLEAMEKTAETAEVVEYSEQIAHDDPEGVVTGEAHDSGVESAVSLSAHRHEVAIGTR